MPRATCLAFFGALVLAAAACGRSELDLGLGTTNITTGSGGDSVSAPGGAAGEGGVTPPLMRIPCGNSSCTPGTEICCVQGSRRRSQETCISATASCDSGASIGCIMRSSCGSGQFCCESLLSPATMCAAPETCATQPGVILCLSKADCPSSASNCCQGDGIGVCAAQACPSGGGQRGQQGPDGQGEGGPQD